MGEKRSQEEIKEDILHLLANSKYYSINLICKKINSNWITVNQAVQELKKEKKVFERNLGRTKFFKIVDIDTYFRLPIENKEKRLCWYLYSKIIKNWQEIKNEIPGALVMQKIITDISDKLKLPLTKGWYLYGEMSVVIPLQEIKEINFPKKEYPGVDEKNLNSVLQKIISEYAKCKSDNEVIEKHYLRAPEIYKLKREISKILAFGKNKEQIDKINKLLVRFLLYSPSEEDAKEILKNIYEFVILVGKFVRINKFIEPQINLDIKITFEKLWELVSSYIFSTQILDSFKSKLLEDKRREIKDYFLNIIETKKSDFSLAFDSLKEKYASIINKEDIKLETVFKNKEIAFAFSSMNLK